MSHSFDFSSISEKLFMLRNLAAGSREYCKSEKILKSIDSYDNSEWRGYDFRLRRIISQNLIECSAKSRIFQDSVDDIIDASILKEADFYARKNCSIGNVVSGNFALTVRESCNKIIHATSVDLAWANSRVKKPYYRFTYWTGKYHLFGKHGKNQWHVELDIPNWCNALDFYLDHLLQEIDWDELPYE